MELPDPLSSTVQYYAQQAVEGAWPVARQKILDDVPDVVATAKPYLAQAAKDIFSELDTGSIVADVKQQAIIGAIVVAAGTSLLTWALVKYL